MRVRTSTVSPLVSAAPPRASAAIADALTYTVPAALSRSRIGPSASADTSAPTTIAICCERGVAPTKNPVFKSWEVVPPLDAAMHTIAPIDRAVT